MSDDQKRTRIIRRDEDVRRLRQLTVAAGVVGVGLFGAASVVAATSQPGHPIGASDSSGGTVQTATQAQPAFQQPVSAPFGGRHSRAVAISGGS